MNKKVLSIAVAGALGILSHSAHANLTSGTVLDFTGSFTLGTNLGPVTTPIQSGPDGGIIIGATQDTNGHVSHSGTTLHVAGGLDLEWTHFGQSGMHFTTSPILVVDNDVNNDGGFTKTLDFSGWRVTWNGEPSIHVGGGLQNCGTTTDGICIDPDSGQDVSGTYDGGSGLATITCSTASCSHSSSFTLTYSAVTYQGLGVPYDLNLTGHINAVPLPPAAWLLGSGLAGLLLRRRRGPGG